MLRHGGAAFRSAPLARHVAYLERDGVTRDGATGIMFDAGSGTGNGEAFAARCRDDRHHFRFIVSPEDAAEMDDLRAFTRELMQDMSGDLGTRLDWVAVDHWNTDNPHVHILVRGVAEDGRDLVIDRGYISEGFRARAEERVTIELGPRSERDIQAALRREVEAARWTTLDRRLQGLRDEHGLIDLRPEAAADRRADRTLLIGRAQHLETMGLVERAGPASWRLSSDLEPTLRELGERGDIIKTMHRAMSGRPGRGATEGFAIHGGARGAGVVGRLVERGLHDELTGEAYAVVDALDGDTHYLRFPEIERTGDAAPGSIVEAGAWIDRRGREQISLLVRSDIPVGDQIEARGSTWLDRQLLSSRPAMLGVGFGHEVREALEQRTQVLVGEGLARRQGRRVVFARNLLDTLRDRDVAEAGEALASRHGAAFQPAGTGDTVAGIYRRRVTLASGRFAMLDSGTTFQLVPWRQDLERHLGQQIAGRIAERGVDWSFARARGPGL